MQRRGTMKIPLDRFGRSGRVTRTRQSQDAEPPSSTIESEHRAALTRIPTPDFTEQAIASRLINRSSASRRPE